MYCSNEYIDFVCWKIPSAIHQPIQSGLENHSFVSPESYLLASLTYGKSAIFEKVTFFSADEFRWSNRWISVRHSIFFSLKFELSKWCLFARQSWHLKPARNRDGPRCGSPWSTRSWVCGAFSDPWQRRNVVFICFYQPIQKEVVKNTCSVTDNWVDKPTIMGKRCFFMA